MSLRTVISYGLTLLLLCSGPLQAGDSAAPTTPLGCYCTGPVGNVDCDYEDRVDIADLQLLIDHLFIDFTPLPNRYEANIDADPMLVVDIADLTRLIEHLFILDQDLPACPEPVNHPPVTAVAPVSNYLTHFAPSAFFVDASGPRGPAHGVKMSWSASDTLDHGDVPPEHSFQWRLYGPYTDEEFDDLTSRFVEPVFVSAEGMVYPLGEGIALTVCDTVIVSSDYDSVGLAVMCDTLLLDTISVGNRWGTVREWLRIDDEEFVSSSLDRISSSSLLATEAQWTTSLSDTMYNVFGFEEPSSVTRDGWFVFWVQARDAEDSTLCDPVPAWVRCNVVDPRFERDVLAIDTRLYDHAQAWAKPFWQQTIQLWAGTRPDDGIVFDTTCDYMRAYTNLHNPDILRQMLSHKILVLLKDNMTRGVTSDFYGNFFVNSVYCALDAGVSAWSAMRFPALRDPLSEHSDWSVIIPPPAYPFYWGVDTLRYSMWHVFAFADPSPRRTEEFVGLMRAENTTWPEATLDTARLHGFYADVAYAGLPWIDSLPALPEVNWFNPVPEAEVIYVYRSLYGEASPLGYHGKPVMVRLERERFRTIHSLFTPVPLEVVDGQTIVNRALDWLYDGFLHR
ncbi:MAG: hypothetical protein KKA42_15885 [candidate division Zixibacteria bacterium]|nr:hypothetical protein [candidate division Zixibacteria bacterium]